MASVYRVFTMSSARLLIALNLLTLFKKKLFITLGCAGSWLLRTGLALAAETGSYSLLQCTSFSTAVASLVVEHRLQAGGLQ